MQTPSHHDLPGWLKALYPFQTYTFVTPPGARMNYVDEGPRGDEAVLMLHGNPTWSFFYRDLIRAVSPTMRCIVPDHIGMGLSDKPADYPYRLETRIADVEALVASLGLKKVHLVVHDWGGAIGFGFATRHADLVGRITILNTAAYCSDRIPGRISICRAGAVGEFLVRAFNAFAWPATWMSMHARKLKPDEARGFLFPYDSWSNRIAVHRFVADIPLENDHPSRATLAAVEEALPALAGKSKMIVWGARDFCFHDHFLDRWREIYPDAQVRRLREVGHYVLDDGGPAVRDEIRAFLLNETSNHP